MRLSGARIVVECLRRQGVDTVFGYPGGQIMPLYDALYDAPLRHVLTVHEQGAAHAADGYARASGRTGVCIATSGPGATNLVTGLATAYLDSVPLVAITGQVSTALLGRDAFQEVDITGITMPVTKYNYLVRSTDELSAVLADAFRVAAEGRPGPVLVDIPRDVLVGETEYVPADPPPRPRPARQADKAATAAAAAAIQDKPEQTAAGAPPAPAPERWSPCSATAPPAAVSPSPSRCASCGETSAAHSAARPAGEEQAPRRRDHH